MLPRRRVSAVLAALLLLGGVAAAQPVPYQGNAFRPRIVESSDGSIFLSLDGEGRRDVMVAFAVSVKRVTDANDRRRVILTLTARGRALDGVKTRTVESAVRRALTSVTPSQVEGSRAVLLALIRELESSD